VSDRPRLLHRRSEVGYTDRLREALPDEPEAVDTDTQRHLTRQAGRRRDDRRRDCWSTARGQLEEAVHELRQAFGPEVAPELRGIRREIDRLARKLAG